MITAIVRYKLPATIGRKECLAHFHKIAPGFVSQKGLIRKQFIWGENGIAGGVYQWETLADAQGVLSRSLARRHSPALRHLSGDRILHDLRGRAESRRPSHLHRTSRGTGRKGRGGVTVSHPASRAGTGRDVSDVAAQPLSKKCAPPIVGGARRERMREIMTSILRALLFAAILGVAGGAHAQSSADPTGQAPSCRPAPGHAVDIVARILATGVSQTLGQTVFVENKPGTSGFARRADDRPRRTRRMDVSVRTGVASVYRTCICSSRCHTIRRGFRGGRAGLRQGAIGRDVNPDLPVTTVPELIAYGKANPGKLSYAVDTTAALASRPRGC